MMLLIICSFVVHIVGIEIGDHGHSCEDYEICGSVLRNDMVICLQKVLFVVFTDYDCLTYHNHCHHGHNL